MNKNFNIQNKIFRNEFLKDIHTEEYKKLMKEIKEDTNKWVDTLC